METQHLQDIYFGMGCFWGAEKRLRAVPGVAEVEVGYAGGDAPKVDYEGVLREERLIRAGRSQARNHAEVVRVRYDPKRLDLMTLLAAFWENHDPTQVGGQGNDIGSNYRSAIYFTSEAQKTLAEQSRAIYQANLTKAGYGAITTEILPVRHYNRAEESHQDYLVKNPDGSGDNVLAFRSNKRNTYIGGAPRCEGMLNQPASRLQKKEVMWHAFSMWIDERFYIQWNALVLKRFDGFWVDHRCAIIRQFNRFFEGDFIQFNGVIKPFWIGI